MLRKRIQNKKAFTLAETLVAIIIMLLASSIMVTGIPAAKNAYEKVFLKSNAEVLMSTAIYSLRNELSLARDVEEDETDSTKVSYLNGAGNAGSIIKVDAVNANSKGIVIKRFGGDWESLVSKSASDGMYLKYGSVERPEGKNYIIIHDLGVYKKVTDSEPIINRSSLAITVL